MAKGFIGRGIGILMGIVILLADIYWTYLAYSGSHAVSLPVTLGIVIFLADIVWLFTER